MKHSDQSSPLFEPKPRFAGIARKLAPEGHPLHPANKAHPDDVSRLNDQNALVLRWLRAGIKVNPLMAEAQGVHRLAARAFDLRRAGHDVRSKRNPETKCNEYWIEQPAGA